MILILDHPENENTNKLNTKRKQLVITVGLSVWRYPFCFLARGGASAMM
jgi:hypothetical protein